MAIALPITFSIALQGQTPTSSFVPGSSQDEAAVRAIVENASADKVDPHTAPDLDWENAFGIRYFNLQKRDKFYGAVVKPLQKDASDSTIEIKVRFVTPDVAVADEYWHIVGQLNAQTRKTGPDRWGRTTYICKKENGIWIEVLERVADLRYAYFKHYDEMPKPVPVPIATLASYAGEYVGEHVSAAGTPAREITLITLTGDHLTIQYDGRTGIGVPTSDHEFLVFDPEDLAEYYKISFAKEADGRLAITLAASAGMPFGKAVRLK